MSAHSHRGYNELMSALPPSRYFPPVEFASEDGLLCVGGQLSPDWIRDAYRHGIFPWPVFDDSEPMAWWSPDPRAIIELDRFHVPRRLARTIRSGKFELTINHEFRGVIAGCATAQHRRFGTWITPRLKRAYLKVHEQGWAHSVEAWHEGKLAGGVYGIAIGGFFAGESMFYRVPDASKVALAHLVERLRVRGYRLFDIQQYTGHTGRFGAIEISRRAYLKRLTEAIDLPVTFGD